MPPHPLTSFEIYRYYQNELRFDEVCSRDNLSDKIKNGALQYILVSIVELEPTGLICTH